MEGDQSTSSSLSTTVMTFYNDLADEVDQHFARALHSGSTTKKAPSYDDTKRSDTGKMTHWSIIKDLHNIINHSTGNQITAYSPPMAMTPIVSADQDFSPFGSTQVLSSRPLHLPLLLDQSQHSNFPFYPPQGNVYPTRGAIIYPEFVNHLVHPDVDSFKDIPKLPGQTNTPPSSAASFSLSTLTSNEIPSRETSPTPSAYNLLHSPLQSDSPVHLSDEDLQQILELNKDTMYA